MAEEEPNVAFAFSPAQAVQELLDYTKSEHSKIYKSAIREVCKEPFECKADGLYQFVFANLEYCGASNLWISVGSACS
jgi:hypothetical protein